MKAKRLTMIATLVAVAILFVGCKKEKVDATSQNANNQMLKFNSFEEVFDYMTRQNAKESNDGFLSYGQIADSEYEELSNNNSFSSMEDIFQFVEHNKNKYQLIMIDKGEYIVETRFYDHPYRYVANSDGIFQVQDTIYKLIEGGLAYASKGSIDDLMKCNQVETNNTNVSFFYFDNRDSKDYAYSCPNVIEAPAVINGNNMITLKVENYTRPSGYGGSLVGIYYLAKPYHKSIGWWGCQRTMTFYLNGVVHYIQNDPNSNNPTYKSDNWGYYPTGIISYTKGGFKCEDWVYALNPYGVSTNHIGAVQSHVTTLDSGTASINCNTEIL